MRNVCREAVDDRRAWDRLLGGVPGPLKAMAAFGAFAANTLFWSLPLLAGALLKLVIPLGRWRSAWDRVLNALAGGWIAVNNRTLSALNRICWDVDGIEGLDPRGWYLVIANHQSWVDIVVLQKVFHRRIPFLKFFLKKELIWVPVLGLAWWALDFPFVKRYSRTFLERRPHLRGRDIAITRKACAKFKRIPVSIMNFVEGTRFTPEKHRRQDSPYRHLLRPKSGGAALVLQTLGERLDAILDVTIVYPGGVKTFWDLLCGRLDAVQVRVDRLPVAPLLKADGEGGSARLRFQEWMNAVWTEKDRRIGAMLQSAASQGGGS